MKNLCTRNTFDYRRYLQMQVSDCVIKCTFPSTSTLLNPMRPSSQNLFRKIFVDNKLVLPLYSRLFCPEFDHMPNFFRAFCFHFGIVCFCNPMTCSGISREMAESSFDPFSNPISKKTQFWSQTNKQTSKQTN